MVIVKSKAKHTLCRRLGRPVCGLKDCPAIKRPYGLGQHGGQRGRRRKKESIYGKQLEEKQKVKFIYGISERQLKNLVKKVSAIPGPSGEMLLSRLESRLDNIVYRLGLAPTRWAAQQMVAHKHIQVNEKTVNIRSYYLEPGDKVRVRPDSSTVPKAHESIQTSQTKPLPYLTLDKAKLEGVLLGQPLRNQIPEAIQENLVVEFYAR